MKREGRHSKGWAWQAVIVSERGDIGRVSIGYQHQALPRIGTIRL